MQIIFIKPDRQVKKVGHRRGPRFDLDVDSLKLASCLSFWGRNMWQA